MKYADSVIPAERYGEEGDPDAGVNTVCNVASLVKSIDPCEKIVRELGGIFVE